MYLSELCLASLVSVFSGIDRTAGPQIMLSRPLVAAPLTGLALGNPLIGLEVGGLLELLWLCRVPAGATIPPDDTQIGVGATFLAIVFADYLKTDPLSVMLFSVLVACPLGRMGSYFDRWARHVNGKGNARILRSVREGVLEEVEGVHLSGLLSFGLASWFSFLSIVLMGGGALVLFYPWMEKLLLLGGGYLKTAFPLVGIMALLGTMRVRYSLTLFLTSFASTLLLLWYF